MLTSWFKALGPVQCPVLGFRVRSSMPSAGSNEQLTWAFVTVSHKVVRALSHQRIQAIGGVGRRNRQTLFSFNLCFKMHELLSSVHVRIYAFPGQPKPCLEHSGAMASYFVLKQQVPVMAGDQPVSHNRSYIHVSSCPMNPSCPWYSWIPLQLRTEGSWFCMHSYALRILWKLGH